MERVRNILDQERGFLSQVARAAFANPFGAARSELDREIAGSSSAGTELDAVVRRVAASSERLQAVLRGDFARLPEGDRATVRTVFLFDYYHRYLADFDALIVAQGAAGDAPCAVPFAAALCADFARAGFTRSEAERYLAFFYQLRRAFFFIGHGLTGTSPSQRRLREELWQALFTHDIGTFEAHLWNRMEDFSVLLLGETGTGKGAAAAAIGRSGHIPFDARSGRFSESFTRNFLAVNLSQYAAGTLESELFGHRKGAFTGAIDHHDGVFARCTPHGAIFLDEIGDLALPVQVKLLQVLQERSFTPVGSAECRRFSGRIIAATHQDLSRLRAQGSFRDDFYYRLCSAVVRLPALRERLDEAPEELDTLVGAILERLLGRGAQAPVAAVAAAVRRDVGTDYLWPGNVRELEQSVRAILVSGRYRGVVAATAPLDPYLAAVAAGSLDAVALLSGYCRILYRQTGTIEEVSRRLDLDRRTVKKYLHRNDGFPPVVD
jgi:hypothetical protein